MKTQYRHDVNQDSKNKYYTVLRKTLQVYFTPNESDLLLTITLIHVSGMWGWGMKGILFKKKFLNDECIPSSEIMQIYILYFGKLPPWPNGPTAHPFPCFTDQKVLIKEYLCHIKIQSELSIPLRFTKKRCNNLYFFHPGKGALMMHVCHEAQ